MTRERLAALASAALGPQWQRALARQLINPKTRKPVNDRTVRRWAAGGPIPPFVESALQEIWRKRLAEIRDAGRKRRAKT